MSITESGTGTRPPHSAARRDVLVIAAVTCALLATAVAFDLADTVREWMMRYEEWELDEFFLLPQILSIGFTCFAIRRWREWQAEATLRRLAESALLDAKFELEKKVEERTADLRGSNERLLYELDERRRVEELLRESEERYRQIVERADDIIFSADLHGYFTFVNPPAVRLMKRPAEEFVGTRYIDLIRPDHRPEAEAFYARQLAERTPCTYYEFPAIAHDGSEVWFGQNVQLIFKDGGITGFQAVARDITERKRSEEAVRKAEEYRNLFQLANDYIIIFEPDDEIVLDVNDKACKVYGVTRESFIGRSIKEFSLDADRGQQHLQQLLANGTYQEFETVQRRADGTPLNFLINASVIEYHGHQAVLSINRDVTARRRTEEMIRLLAHAIESTSELISITDFEDRFTFANKAFMDAYGYALEEIIGQTPAKVDSPNNPPGLRHEIEEQTCRGGWSGELLNRRKDGSEFPLSLSTSVIRDGQGQIVGLLGIGKDITERQLAEERLRQSEEQLRQAQKMESIGTLTGGIAHDFNNLLTAITGFSELSLMRLDLNGQVRRNIEEVKRAADRAANLTRQLLAFSRCQRLERKNIGLNELIGDLMKMLRRIIGEDVDVRWLAASNLSPVFADPGQIEQVVMNLAVNARDAMPGGGLLTIETQNVLLDEYYCRTHSYVKPGKYAQLTVSDTGVGMDAEIRNRIFEPFFTTKEVGKGTGLGLSTAYGIIKQHEGFIEVYSEPGVGTTFKTYLPVREGLVEEQTQAALPIPRGGRETILVAEDEEMLRMLAKNILEDLGYEVLLAVDGQEAVELYQAHFERIDLLLLDMVMPRTGGFGAYEQIRRLRADVPVIFMTGYSIEVVQNKFIQANKTIDEMGAMVLQKPYSLDKLGRKVREVLNGAERM